MTQDQEHNPYEPPVAVDASSPARPDQQIPAERGTRLGAALIDGLLLLPSLGAAMAVLGLEAFARETARNTAVTFLFMLPVIAFQWWLIATTGQSIAKRWLGIRIVKLDGSAVGFAHGVALRAMIPNAISMIPYLGYVFSVVDALFIFGQDRRCLHDHLAGTKVITAI